MMRVKGMWVIVTAFSLEAWCFGFCIVGCFYGVCKGKRGKRRGYADEPGICTVYIIGTYS